MIWFLFVVLVYNFGTTMGSAMSSTTNNKYISSRTCSTYSLCRGGPDDSGYSGTGSSSSTATSAYKATLPSYEAKAIKSLLRSSKRPWDAGDFSETDCGTRNEVNCTCDDTSKICHVTEIYCEDHELSGPIPEELGDLSSLQILSLGRNKLNGPIPHSFSKLLNLKTIDLDDNLLEGPVPSFLGNMTALIVLSLNDNLFEGPIPSELSNLSSLQFLDLGRNRLSGTIPYQIGRITNLMRLHLYDNQLSGTLPPEIGNLVNLGSLALENNKLIGPLPQRFKQLQNLYYVSLRGNKFTGKVPEDIGNWKYLQTLWLLGNNFEGPLPRAIASLKYLTHLGVSDLIDTSREKSGFPFPDIPRTILRFLILGNCSITGKIPDYIFQMQNLSYLDLSFNNLTGGIPNPSLPPWMKPNVALGTNPNASPPPKPRTPRFIFLRGNKLNGSIPEWLLNKKYGYVDVSENNFALTEPPPANLSKNLNLFECANTTSNVMDKWLMNPYTCQNKMKHSRLFINCGGEETPVNGTNYEADLESNGGATFFLSKNGRWGYSSMGTFINSNQDMFIANRTCNMSMADSPLYTSARLAPISLKYYGFCLENGNYKVKLHFAEIVLDPDQGLTSKARRVFDIEIQGKKVETDFNIAEAAGGVNQNITKEYNTFVNNSRLEIHLFWTGMGSIYEPTVHYGPLISAISATRVEKKHNRLSPLAISGIVGASLLLPLLILLILWRRGCFSAEDPEIEEIKAELQGKFFSFQQIKAATGDFSSDNKLGEGGFGSVFKGVLSNGTAIAVKQFSARSMQGIREFVNEIGTVSALQHPNLVKLLGCCAEDTQRLLIYEYMENNSLHHALFVSEELKKRLNWATRVKICHDIAKGLVFLHEESELKVVHRDIKPTNILLDKDLTAKISDFGFAKLYEEGEASHIITRIAGTTGYMAPEYAMRGHLTYKADVYSFGVVLLEIVSGKNSAIYQPNDQSVYLLDMACVLQKEKNLIDLVDPNLEDYVWDEANTILNLALLCTDRSYTLRPTMSEVVQILEGESNISNYSIGDHYSMDDSAMAKVIAGLSQSTHSGSNSHAGNSAVSLSAACNSGISGKETSSS